MSVRSGSKASQKLVRAGVKNRRRRPRPCPRGTGERVRYIRPSGGAGGRREHRGSPRQRRDARHRGRGSRGRRSARRASLSTAQAPQASARTRSRYPCRALISSVTVAQRSSFPNAVFPCPSAAHTLSYPSSSASCTRSRSSRNANNTPVRALIDSHPIRRFAVLRSSVSSYSAVRPRHHNRTPAEKRTPNPT